MLHLTFSQSSLSPSFHLHNPSPATVSLHSIPPLTSLIYNVVIISMSLVRPTRLHHRSLMPCNSIIHIQSPTTHYHHHPHVMVIPTQLCPQSTLSHPYLIPPPRLHSHHHSLTAMHNHYHQPPHLHNYHHIITITSSHQYPHSHIFPIAQSPLHYHSITFM
jgi:hypothetical protein